MPVSDLTPDNEITGASDGTKIGNVGDRLKVEAEVVVAKVQVSSNDGTSGHLKEKIIAADESNSTNAVEIKEVNDGGDEDLKIAFDESKITITESQISDLSSNVFGTEFQNTQNMATGSTTSTTWQTRLSITTPTIPAGDYMIVWDYNLFTDSVSTDVEGRIRVDDSDVIDDVLNDGSEGYYDHYLNWSGYSVETLTNASHTIDLDYRRQGASNTVYINNARLTIYRIS